MVDQNENHNKEKCFIVYEIYHIMGVFTIGVPKKNDLFLKDYKGQLWIFFIVHYYNCSELLH
jgi:hypothetical protein